MRKNFIKRFILCGFTGWTFECFWTGLHAIFFSADKTLPCKTSVWMFPIYGLAAVIAPISQRLKGKSILTRGGVYTLLIFLVEFITGSILRVFHACPWNYADAKFQFRELIRLDYAPLWFVSGLFFEHLLQQFHKWELYQKVYGHKK